MARHGLMKAALWAANDFRIRVGREKPWGKGLWWKENTTTSAPDGVLRVFEGKFPGRGGKVKFTMPGTHSSQQRHRPAAGTSASTAQPEGDKPTHRQGLAAQILLQRG